jgi:serpin B
VAENGTEAAAATGVMMAGAGPPTRRFIADRPFMFFIRDASGAVLFAGQVVDPSR